MTGFRSPVPLLFPASTTLGVYSGWLLWEFVFGGLEGQTNSLVTVAVAVGPAPSGSRGALTNDHAQILLLWPRVGGPRHGPYSGLKIDRPCS